MYDLKSICLNEESPQAVTVVILVLSTSLAFLKKKIIFMSVFIAIYMYHKVLQFLFVLGAVAQRRDGCPC